MLQIITNDIDSPKQIIFKYNTFEFCIPKENIKKYKATLWRSIINDNWSQRFDFVVDSTEYAIEYISSKKCLYFTIESIRYFFMTFEIPLLDCTYAINKFAEYLEQESYNVGGTEYIKALNKINELSKTAK